MKNNMKNNWIFILLLSLFASGMTGSCSKDELDPNSIFVDKSMEEMNAFDKWILDSLTTPYNMTYIYRYIDSETDFSYKALLPVETTKAWQLAKILKHTWMGTYSELAGEEFTKKYIPKTLLLLGGPMYKDDGKIVNGEAEGGVKITFTRVNELPTTTGTALNQQLTGPRNGYGILKTAFHEFTHLLTQTKNFPTEFPAISANQYRGDDWDANDTGGSSDTIALQTGFISKYARKNADEDIAEMLAIYVTRGDAIWQSCMKDAVAHRSDTLYVPNPVTGETERQVTSYLDSTGYYTISKKMEYVRSYLQDSWSIDLDTCRTVFEKRLNSLNDVLK
jgi:substrate import-associated zinc metallohydrolase lipoprotein